VKRQERGQVLPLVALLVVALAGAAVFTVHLGALAAQRARASASADAAALAGAAEGRSGAERLARANGGRLAAYRKDGDDTEVRVTFGRAGATARATGGRTLARGGEAPALQAVLARAAQLLGRPVAVARVLGDGLTVEVSPDDAAALAPIAAGAGLCAAADGSTDRFRVCSAHAAGS
jgi:hypothetical protein